MCPRWLQTVNLAPHRVPRAVALLCFAATAAACEAQISFASAVDLAVRNNPRVLVAQDDVRKSQAMLKETRDVYIPSVIANGGAGESYGITLNVPTIFTANAQSLLYSPAQRDYLRAAHKQLEAARMRADAAKDQVEEDTADEYLEVDHSQKKLAALEQEYSIAEKLVSTMEDRHDRGIETGLELKRSRRTAIEIRLARLKAEDELAFHRLHLAGLVGLPEDRMTILPESIPSGKELAPPAVVFDLRAPIPIDEADAMARGLRAAGDARSRWKPSISFAAQYGRISPINGVTDFYNIHGQYNTFFGGITLQFPVFDAVQRAHAQETGADAAHAFHQLESIREDATENRLRLHHANAELEAKADLAEIDYEIAQDELASILAQANSARPGAPLMTPMDQDRAMLRERQTYVQLLDAGLDLRKVQIALLRQSGELDRRIHRVHNGTTP